MMTQNRLTSYLQKRETALKWLIAAIVYTALFAVLENPLHATISDVGRVHHVLFSVYCLFYGVGMLLNLNYLRRTYQIHAPFLVKLTYIFNLFVGLVATTLLPPKNSDGGISLIATIVHWIFGFGGFIVNATAALVFCLFLYRRTKQKKVQVLVAVGSVICLLDMLCFVGLTVLLKDPLKSKNGLFELVPVFTTYIVLYIVNHTDFVRPRTERDLSESSLTASDHCVFTAAAYASLASAWLLFSTFAFVRSPIRFTISQIGLDYFGGFALTCLFISVSFLLNHLFMFRKSAYKNYFVMALAIVSSVSLLLCVIQPTTMNKDISPVHAIPALLFFFGNLGVFIIYLISKYKQNKRYGKFLLLFVLTTAAELITMLLLFVVFDQKYGRTGLTELIPLELMYAFFYFENYTDHFSKEKTNAFMV